MKYPVEDEMVNMSEYYPGMYTQPEPQQGPLKPRRRRKKNQGENNEGLMRKRKLSEEQVNLLELSFGSEHKLESERKDRLASELGLDPRQVAVWFQNRRARYKSKKMEDEYNKLKAKHDSTVVEKCRLENEMLKLKDQLSDAEKVIKNLFERGDGFSKNSPSSSFSMESMGPLFPEDFGMEGMENIFYEPENYTYQGMDWVNNYI